MAGFYLLNMAQGATGNVASIWAAHERRGGVFGCAESGRRRDGDADSDADSDADCHGDADSDADSDADCHGDADLCSADRFSHDRRAGARERLPNAERLHKIRLQFVINARAERMDLPQAAIRMPEPATRHRGLRLRMPGSAATSGDVVCIVPGAYPTPVVVANSGRRTTRIASISRASMLPATP